MQTKLRFCESWSVVRLPDGTPVVVTHTEKRGQRVIQLRRDHMRWVDKDEPVELLLSPAELAHNYLETLSSAPIYAYGDEERQR